MECFPGGDLDLAKGFGIAKVQKNAIKDVQIWRFGPRGWSRYEKGPEISDFLDLLPYERVVKVQSDIPLLN